MMEPIVIAGSGLAGITVAREFRKLDKTTPLLIVSANDGGFYSKPSLSNAFAAGKNPESLLLTRAEILAEQLAAEIRGNTRIEEIRSGERKLHTSSGVVAYNKLVLALGAHPIRLPIAGDGAADVLSVNDLHDYSVFRQRLVGKSRVAILGAGLIGCEFANDLVSAGIKVDVLDLAPQPLGRLLPSSAAGYFRARLEAAGVRFHFGTSLALIERTEGAYRLTDQNGAAFETDLLLSAVGLKPAVELAAAAELRLGRGIAVNKYLQSSDPNVFALGDCAEVDGLVLPFVLPIMQAARALAKTLAGTPTEVVYPAMPVVVKTPACPTVVCPPPAGVAGAWREEVGPNGVRAIFENEAGTASGFALLGEAVAERQALAQTMPAWL